MSCASFYLLPDNTKRFITPYTDISSNFLLQPPYHDYLIQDRWRGILGLTIISSLSVIWCLGPELNGHTPVFQTGAWTACKLPRHIARLPSRQVLVRPRSFPFIVAEPPSSLHSIFRYIQEI